MGSVRVYKRNSDGGKSIPLATVSDDNASSGAGNARGDARVWKLMVAGGVALA